MNTIGERVERWRLKAALSQPELAHRAGVAQDTVRGIEKGDQKPHIRTVRKLAEALGVEPAALLKEVVVPEPPPPQAPGGSPYTLEVPDHLTLTEGIVVVEVRDNEGNNHWYAKPIGNPNLLSTIGILSTALDAYSRAAAEGAKRLPNPARERDQ